MGFFIKSNRKEIHMEITAIYLLAVVAVIGIIIIVLLAKQPKTIGKIIITDEDSLYVELNDYDSMEEIHNSKSVTFEVWHEKQISPK